MPSGRHRRPERLRRSPVSGATGVRKVELKRAGDPNAEAQFSREPILQWEGSSRKVVIASSAVTPQVAWVECSIMEPLMSISRRKGGRAVSEVSARFTVSGVALRARGFADTRIRPSEDKSAGGVGVGGEGRGSSRRGLPGEGP